MKTASAKIHPGTYQMLLINKLCDTTRAEIICSSSFSYGVEARHVSKDVCDFSNCHKRKFEIWMLRVIVFDINV
jgi:hypothetical protein